MQTISRQPIGTVVNVNQVGHYKEFIAGAGNSVFKINREGVFVGRNSFTDAKNNTFAIGYDGILYTKGIVATNGTFRGTIYAEAGAIEGDLVVSGSLYSDTGGYRTKMFNGRLSFLYNNTERAFIMASDNGTGIQVSSASNIYLTKINGAPIFTLDQNGGIVLNSPLTSYIAWGSSSGRKISADSSRIIIDGDLTPDTAWGQDLGSSSYQWNNIRGGDIRASSKFHCQSQVGVGTGQTIGLISSIRASGGNLQAKYREFKYYGGIITQIGNEGNWENMGGY